MKKAARYLLAILISILHIIPFFILINASFKADTDTSSKWITPNYIYLENFVHAWNDAKLGRALLNNTIITVFTVLLVIVVGSSAAYPLARYKTKLNRFMYNLFISCMIVPSLTILVPLYKLLVQMHGISTHWGMVVTLVAFQLPLSIFLFTGFVSTISKELDEAALIDGCSRFGIFFRIIYPLLKPVTATVTILTGVAAWNDYQFSVFFLQRPQSQTTSVALSMFFSQYTANISWTAAGCLVSALPATIAYLALQKYFIKGLAAGALKM